MIYIFHGADAKASYERLRSIESKFKSGEKLKLSKEHSYDDLIQGAFSTSALTDTRLVVIQNFIKDKKEDFKNETWQKDVDEKTLIFYETSQITPAAISKLPKHFLIEVFKEEPKIFWFLDSISPDKSQTLKALFNLVSAEDGLLIWNLTYRFLLLTLAKTNTDVALAGNITGRQLAPWQWQKIKNQAQFFNLDSLKNIFRGLLKIDYLLKTGKTELPPRTLISFLLLKYLRS